ncbi:hypothetical protein TKK_0016816 [Trichogramma kaykai]|uniref:acid phosphatase n=1 Tax=Trichogramma kaykai TaxID=54128 RepID=A0ABD2W508_9HYME
MSKNIREQCAFYYLKIFGLTGNIDFKNSKKIGCLHYYSTKLPLFSAVYSVVFVSILISSQCNSVYEMSLIHGYEFKIVVDVLIHLLISLAYVDFFAIFYRKHEAIQEVLEQMNAVRILTGSIEKNRDKKSSNSMDAIVVLYSITFVLILSKVVLHVTFCLYQSSWDFDDFGDHMLDLLMHGMTMHYITTIGVCHAAFKAINRSLLSLLKRFNLLFSRKIVLSKKKPSLIYNIMDQQQPRDISIYRNYNNARFNEQVTKLKTYYAVVVKLARNLSSLYQTVLFLCLFRYFITIISSSYTLAEIVVCNSCPLTPILDICKHLFNIIFHLVSLVMLTGLATVTLNESNRTGKIVSESIIVNDYDEPTEQQLCHILDYLTCNDIHFSVHGYYDINDDLVVPVFRHGERTFQRDEAKFISDRSSNLQEPWGFAQLTNEGKKDEYKIGTLLRERYDSFLGDYHPSLVYGISTNFDRTKNSLQLALSGLYPPSTKLRWNRELAWNPIPINSVPDKFDSLFRLDSCPAYTEEYNRLMNSTKMQSRLSKDRALFRLLNSFYPDVDFSLKEIFLLNNYLNIQKSLNGPMPFWYSQKIHDKIHEMVILYLESLSKTDKLKRMNGGPLTKRMYDNMLIDASQRPTRKIYLYSAHEFNVYAVAKALGLELEDKPEYGSALIIEKIRDDFDGQVYVRMLYYVGRQEEIKILMQEKKGKEVKRKPLDYVKLKDCDYFCPIEKFYRIVRSSFPTKEESLCMFKDLSPTDIENIIFKSDKIIQD